MVRRLLPLVLVALACAAPPPPPPVASPVPEPVVETKPKTEQVIGTVTVTASALNVRREPATDAEVVLQAKKGERLNVLARDESWVKVRLESGESGWVAARFVSDSAARTAPKRSRSGCPGDSDFAFTKTPTLAFSDRPAKGMVVVEASVNAKGDVTSTKLISNTTGEETLAFLAQREIREAKFSPPIRNCVAKSFIFTYRRTF
jgi:outer membrane biosynthesis protein TonB